MDNLVEDVEVPFASLLPYHAYLPGLHRSAAAGCCEAALLNIDAFIHDDK